MPTLYVSSLHGYYTIKGEVKGTFEYDHNPTWKEVYDSLGHYIPICLYVYVLE